MGRERRRAATDRNGAEGHVLIRSAKSAGFLAAGVLAIATAAYSFSVPELTAPVVDNASIISSSIEDELNTKLKALWRDGGSQIAVLTVDSLDGLTIEQASIQVAEAWKLGDAKRDDGILVMVAPNDRVVRIEVGQGREGDLPDALARRIIDNVMLPRFKLGSYGAGIQAGVDAIVERTDPGAYPLFGGTTSGSSPSYDSSGGKKGNVWLTRILLIIVGCFLLFTRLGNQILFFMIANLGRSRGGSGRSGGGFGGGGYRGGGGGFSGGGATGRW